MEKISETLTELGIAFSFPIEIRDANGKVTYFENSNDYRGRYERNAKGDVTYCEASNDYWYKYERDDNGEATYYENSTGSKWGTPKVRAACEGKVVEVDGIKYKLTAL